MEIEKYTDRPNDGTGPRARRIEYPENPRLQRVRWLSRLLDTSIVLPGGYRIGLDPIFGLLPGLGDVVGMACSLYLVYESARLGIPKRVLARMAGNVAVEALVGTVPVLGDIFDAAWKANIRNLKLLEAHYHPAVPERSARKILVWFGFVAAGLAALTAAGMMGFFWLLFSFL